jgi:hypothetical protein
MIENMLALSTGHLTEQTCNVFMHEWQGPRWEKSEYGWFVYVDEAVAKDDLPEDLAECLAFAMINECHWLMFDCDGTEIVGLPLYDWSKK